MPRLANTFSIEELRAMRSLYASVLRGGDAAAQKLATQPEVVNVMRKFSLMETKHRERVEEANR